MTLLLALLAFALLFTVPVLAIAGVVAYFVGPLWGILTLLGLGFLSLGAES